jgi:hypothetical protein
VLGDGPAFLLPNYAKRKRGNAADVSAATAIRELAPGFLKL